MIGHPAREHARAVLVDWRSRRPSAIPRRRKEHQELLYTFTVCLEERVGKLSERAVPADLAHAADKARTAQDIAACLDYLALIAESCGLLP